MSASESREREKQHEAAVYRVRHNLYLDPYLLNGQVLEPKNNPGIWLNHTRYTLNCKVVPVLDNQQIVALVVVAVRDISKGEELIQDYGREDPNGPDFLYH